MHFSSRLFYNKKRKSRRRKGGGSKARALAGPEGLCLCKPGCSEVSFTRSVGFPHCHDCQRKSFGKSKAAFQIIYHGLLLEKSGHAAVYRLDAIQVRPLRARHAPGSCGCPIEGQPEFFLREQAPFGKFLSVLLHGRSCSSPAMQLESAARGLRKSGKALRLLLAYRAPAL